MADQGAVKNVRVLHRELDLQPLARVVRIDAPSAALRPYPAVFPFVARHRRIRGFTVYQPESLDEMQGFGIGRAKSVDHRVWPDLDADGVDDKRVAFKMADGIAVPGRCDARGMSLIQAYVPNLVIEGWYKIRI